LRLNPLYNVKEYIEQEPYTLIVARPLVESQKARDLLTYFTNSRAVWVYRHYRDVIASHLKVWGQDIGIRNLRPLASGQLENWRAENLSSSVTALVKERFSENMDVYDASALFWYVRNIIFFEQNLHHHERVFACNYQVLVNQPRQTVENIYHLIGRPFPGEQILAGIHTTALGKGVNIPLSKDIEYLCEGLWSQLQNTHGQGKPDQP
jgi:hypothetical protein